MILTRLESLEHSGTNIKTLRFLRIITMNVDGTYTQLIVLILWILSNSLWTIWVSDLGYQYPEAAIFARFLNGTSVFDLKHRCLITKCHNYSFFKL